MTNILSMLYLRVLYASIDVITNANTHICNFFVETVMDERKNGDKEQWTNKETEKRRCEWMNGRTHGDMHGQVD